MGLGPDLGAGSHGPVCKSPKSHEAGHTEPTFVRLTLRPLRSEERVHLAVEAGSKVGDVRRLIEQKFGVAAPAKILRFTKQRSYFSCEDHERITRDRVLHLKDVEWLQNPNAPSTSLVALNPEAFVDRPRPKKQMDVQPEEIRSRQGPAAKVPAPVQEEEEAWRDLRNFKDKFGHYRVVHTHVWVRAAPNVEARRLGLLPQDRIVSGHVLDNWLLLDGPSRSSTGEEIKSGPAWALVDGRAMGYGVLLERQDSDEANAAAAGMRSADLRSQLANERRNEKATVAQASSSSGPPAMSAVPGTPLAAVAQVASGTAGIGTATWLLLPPEEEAGEEGASDVAAAWPGMLRAARLQAPEVAGAGHSASKPGVLQASGWQPQWAQAARLEAEQVAEASHSAAEPAAPAAAKPGVLQAARQEAPEAATSAFAAAVSTAAISAAAAPPPEQQDMDANSAVLQAARLEAPEARTSVSSAAVSTAAVPAAAAAPIPEPQDTDAVFAQFCSRLSLIKEDSHEVLRELLRSEDTRKQAKEVLELLYSLERLKELRAARVSAEVAPAALVLAPAPTVSVVMPEETIHLSTARTGDPLKLRQVFAAGWRYGEWHQDSDRFRQRTPFGMLRGALQPDLLAYLLDRAPFNAVSEDAHMALRRKYRLAREKFEGRSDFVKADWHTMPGLPEVADVFIPRHGSRGPALRAPDHVTAFAAAFRAVNASVWEALAARLRSGLAPRGKEELEGLGGFFADALDEGRHFGVAELQHFWGEGFDGKMHVDGTTSTLHLAVSLSGKRHLHVRSALNKTAPDCQQEVYEMLPGDVYLSSPATFQHQVSYPTCDFKNAMASLHMRFLFEPHWWLKKWVNHTRDMDMREVHSAVADVLHNHRIRLPTLAEVREREVSLRARATL